jgi:hypothetical protein
MKMLKRKELHTTLDTFVSISSLEAVCNAAVRTIKPSSIDHGALVLNQEFDTFNGSRSRLGDGSGRATHHEVD